MPDAVVALYNQDVRVPVKVVVVLSTLSAFGPLSIDLYLPGLPRLSSDFHAAASAGQLTLTACLLGLAFGQLLFGPLSDRLGRRRPILAGLVLFGIVSLACAVAPDVWALVGLRFVQGLSGSAGIVIGRAVARDMVSGLAAARLFSLLMLVNGIAPIVAPVLGGAFLHVTSWRGLFVVLAVIDMVILVTTARWLPETLPVERRRRRGAARAGFSELFHDRFFIAYAVVLGLSIAAMFSYIAGSSFVLEDIYGVSPQQYSLVFGLNAFGILAAAQLNRMLVGRVSPQRLLLAGVMVVASGGTALLVVVLAGGGLAGIIPCLFACVAPVGVIVPNTTALALTDYEHVAGSASAILGVMSFAVGGLAAPLVGVAGRGTAVPMALVIASFGIAALVTLAVASSRGLGAPAESKVLT